jgi:transposase
MTHTDFPQTFVKPSSLCAGSGVHLDLAAGAVDEEWPLQVRDLGCLGVLSSLWDELFLTELCNAQIVVDDQVELAPGLVMKALVMNVLGGRDPLYRVADWAASMPLDVVVGSNVRPEQLNDTTLARHLDRAFDAGGEKLFNAACMRVIDVEKVSVDRVHADTTSRLLFGEYRRQEEDAISITHGHSKDKRPDLKQVMVGLTTSTDGVPLFGQMLSGNTSDKIWHGGMLDVVAHHLVVHQDRPVHYVGDSALVTSDNFARAKKHGIVLTSRLPRTIGITDTIVLRAACGDVVMEDIGSFTERKGATHYEGAVVPDCVVFDQEVQVAVYRPTPANKRSRQIVMRRQKKAIDVAKRAAAQLMKTRFSCEADAMDAARAFAAAHLNVTSADRLIAIATEIAVEEKTQRRRGRPKAGDVPNNVQQVRVLVDVAAQSDNIEAIIARESCFVLVHTGEVPITAKEMMAAYKGQSVVETRFPFLKDPAWADVFFIKTPHRLEALGYVLMLALLLWCVWERRVRKNLHASDVNHIKDTTGMTKVNPTAKVCRHVLANLKLMRLKQNGTYTAWQLTAPASDEQRQVMRFSQSLLAPRKMARGKISGKGV